MDNQPIGTCPSGIKERNISWPKPFKGDRTQINRFLQACILYLQVNKGVYDDDESKVAFVLSLMTDGEAGEWAEQYVTTYFDDSGVKLPSFHSFVTKIKKDFKQEDQIWDAVTRLRNLNQGSRTVEELVSEFRLLVGQAKIDDTSDTGNLYLIKIFENSLNPRIRARILYSEEVPKKIEDWYERAIQFDVNRRDAERRLNQGKNRGKPQTPTYSKSEGKKWNFDKPVRDPNAMDVDRMTIEERQELMRKGACFICKEVGHIAAEHKKGKIGGKPSTFKKDPKFTPKKGGDFKDMKKYIRGLSAEEKEKLPDELIMDHNEDDEEEKVDDDEDFQWGGLDWRQSLLS